MQKKEETITLIMNLGLSKEEAFERFVNHFNNWWPKKYTWSGQKLKFIQIEANVNGKCFEIGPHDFRLDWGRVLEFEKSNKIVFSWQISPIRVPEPDPAKGSEVEIVFKEEDGLTKLVFEHRSFSNHGNGWRKYIEALKSEQGWPYILNRYKRHCETG